MVRCSAAAIRLYIYVYVYVTTLSPLERNNRVEPSLIHYLCYPVLSCPVLPCPVLSLSSPLLYPLSTLILTLFHPLTSSYSIALHSIKFYSIDLSSFLSKRIT